MRHIQACMVNWFLTHVCLMLVAGLEHVFTVFTFQLGLIISNWRSHIFQRGGDNYHQTVMIFTPSNHRAHHLPGQKHWCGGGRDELFARLGQHWNESFQARTLASPAKSGKHHQKYIKIAGRCRNHFSLTLPRVETWTNFLWNIIAWTLHVPMEKWCFEP